MHRLYIQKANQRKPETRQKSIENDHGNSPQGTDRSDFEILRKEDITGM
jgi:hypothetical protein